jgi:hypothetical protein
VSFGQVGGKLTGVPSEYLLAGVVRMAENSVSRRLGSGQSHLHDVSRVLYGGGNLLSGSVK